MFVVVSYKRFETIDKCITQSFLVGEFSLFFLLHCYYNYYRYIGVACGPAGPALAGPLFSWLYTNPMEQYSLAGPLFSPVRRPCVTIYRTRRDLF